MNRLIKISALVLSLAALPLASNAQVFFANLNGPSEDPLNASPGTGFALVTIDDVAHTLAVQVAFSGLTSGTTASHIHTPTPTPGAGAAGVATMVPTFIGFPLGVTSGTYTNSFDTLALSTYNPAFVTANGGTAASAETALFAGIRGGSAYLNVHTSAFPRGEIRGFLQAVPEPGSVAMAFGIGVSSLVAILRRRRR